MVLNETKKAYDRMMQKLCSFACVLAMFTRLRQCAIAPHLITAESKRNNNADDDAVKLLQTLNATDVGVWVHDRFSTAGTQSSKMRACVEIIRRIPPDEKILVFSMFTSCLDLLVDAIKVSLPDLVVEQIDGDVKTEERKDVLHRFRTHPNHRVLLSTYKTGSEGLNLTEATHCICIEPWWTPVVDRQAKHRCWRNGQKRPVYIHVIRVANTIEQRIDEICREKNAMANSYLGGTERDVAVPKLDKYTMGRILGVRQ